MLRNKNKERINILFNITNNLKIEKKYKKINKQIKK